MELLKVKGPGYKAKEESPNFPELQAIRLAPCALRLIFYSSRSHRGQLMIRQSKFCFPGLIFYPLKFSCHFPLIHFPPLVSHLMILRNPIPLPSPGNLIPATPSTYWIFAFGIPGIDRILILFVEEPDCTLLFSLCALRHIDLSLLSKSFYKNGFKYYVTTGE